MAKDKILSIRLSEEDNKEIERIAKKRGIPKHEAYVLWKMRKEGLADDEAVKSKGKSSKSSGSGGLQRITEQVVEKALEPSLKMMDKVSEEVERKLKGGNEPMVVNRGVPPSKVRDIIRRKVDEERKRYENERTLERIMERLDRIEYNVGDGMLNEIERMNMVEQRLKGLGFTREGNKDLIELGKTALPEVLDLAERAVDAVNRKGRLRDFIDLERMMSNSTREMINMVRDMYRNGEISKETCEQIISDIMRGYVRERDALRKNTLAMAKGLEEEREGDSGGEVEV